MTELFWIDDDYQVIKGLMRPTEKRNYKIHYLRTLDEAIEKLNGDIVFDIIIVDLILPLYETTHPKLPQSIQGCTSQDKHEGICLIQYIRETLNQRTPVMILTIVEYSKKIQEQLMEYEIDSYLIKGVLTPTFVDAEIEKILANVQLETAIILNLRSIHPEERKAGLLHVEMIGRPTKRIYEALLDYIEKETQPQLLSKATILAKEYQGFF